MSRARPNVRRILGGLGCAALIASGGLLSTPASAAGGGGVNDQVSGKAANGTIAVKVSLSGSALGNGGTTATGGGSSATVSTVYTPPACYWDSLNGYYTGAQMFSDLQSMPQKWGVGSEANFVPTPEQVTAHKDDNGVWYTIAPGPDSSLGGASNGPWDKITNTCMTNMRKGAGPGNNGGNAGYIFVPAGTQPPPPQGAPPTPEQLRDAALAALTLPVPALGHNPTTQSLVNLATWFWVPRGDFRTWDVTASAGTPVVSATVTATPQSLSVSSAGGSSGPCSPAQGTTSWTPGVGDTAACTVDFLRSSAGQPGQAYTVTGQTSYGAGWTSNVAGHGGALADQVRAGTVPVPVAESQAIVTGQR